MSIPLMGNSRPLAECRLLVLGALAEGPKSHAQLQRRTGLDFAQVYLAKAELRREGLIVTPERAAAAPTDTTEENTDDQR